MKILQASDLAQLALDLPKLDSFSEPARKFYIFTSFDLANSTEYKERHPESWFKLINEFYDHVFSAQGVFSDEERSKVWKLIGDEVLLYQRIETQDMLKRSLSATFSNLQTINKKVIDSDHNKAKHLLRVKGSVWCAAVLEYNSLTESDLDASGLQGRNFGIPQPVDREVKISVANKTLYDNIIDFVGVDLDIGFRVADYTEPGRLAVSALLTRLYLASQRIEDEDEDAKARIVGYRKLKGAWNDFHYPIIWYEEDWGKFKCRYDDKLKASLSSLAMVEVAENHVTNKDLARELGEITVQAGQLIENNEFVQIKGMLSSN